ncbi:hypothetical protein [Paraburkholderia ultramafica]|uniref:hypothetical protein n=1 Tax=Paraburkholderia ultramafica TaxID=1544867 RepID=UPI001581B279|nr:hypothetical protein [Paraburkholderia ultramafica]
MGESAFMLDRWHQRLHGAKMAELSGRLLKAAGLFHAREDLGISKRLLNKDRCCLKHVDLRGLACGGGQKYCEACFQIDLRKANTSRDALHEKDRSTSRVDRSLLYETPFAF